MPNSTQLSKYEKKQIIAYKKCGMSRFEIAKKINRSKTVICNFSNNPKEYGKKKYIVGLQTRTMHQKHAIAH